MADMGKSADREQHLALRLLERGAALGDPRQRLDAERLEALLFRRGGDRPHARLGPDELKDLVVGLEELHHRGHAAVASALAAGAAMVASRAVEGLRRLKSGFGE